MNLVSIFELQNSDVRVWNRDTWSGELVEKVLMGKMGKTISVCHEAQGESVALKHDKKGFFTVSEAKGEDKSGDIDIPTYYYSLKNGIILYQIYSYMLIGFKELFHYL